MGQPVVLPKFELPGDRRHWAVKAAWIAGGLLLISVIGLVAAMVNHQTRQTQAHIAKAEAIAKVKAEAEGKVAMAVAAAKAEREAAVAAKKQAAEAMAAAATSTTGTSVTPGVNGTSAKASSGHRGRASRGGKGTKLASKSTGKPDASKTTSYRPDAIDDLLKKMK